MYHRSIALLSILLAGCAQERIVDSSRSYYKDMSALSRQEVIDNIDATIDDEYRIPTRTTFGKGNLTFTDAGTASAAVPFHILAANAGTATATVGSVSDAYQIALTPEVDGVALGALREAYKAAVHPEDNKDLVAILDQSIGSKGRWLYWTPIGSDAPPPTGKDRPFLVGRGKHYLIWTTNRESFSRFVLLTYGHTADADRVGADGSVVTQRFSTPPAAPKLKGRGASGPPAPVRKGVFNIPRETKPTILYLQNNFTKFLGGKRDGGALNDPIAR